MSFDFRIGCVKRAEPITGARSSSISSEGGDNPAFTLDNGQWHGSEQKTMNASVKSVSSGSPAARSKISSGDILRKIDGNLITDVLDYKFYSYPERILLELIGIDGRIKFVRITKPEGADIGLEFDEYLMDSECSCSNNCVFCFIDQLPRGMRKTLYYKDDDIRMSFLQGNYITLTNLSQNDIDRIISFRISPINVSVHSLSPDLRSFMMGTEKGAYGIKVLKTLARAGITLNCQIVCCPGINDGDELRQSLEEFIRLGESINSVSIVPVGLTSHREGLMELRLFDETLAGQTIVLVDKYADFCLKNRGSRVFYCADELYIKAGLKLPANGYYEDYPQLENGVGMMRLLMTEFYAELRHQRAGAGCCCARRKTLAAQRNQGTGAPFTVVTGMAASAYLTELLKSAERLYGRIKANVVAIKNDFFGHTVTVAGLVTGGDIIAQLEGFDLGSRVLIPRNMLRRGEDVFLDDVTVMELSAALNTPVEVVGVNGAEFLRAVFRG